MNFCVHSFIRSFCFCCNFLRWDHLGFAFVIVILLSLSEQLGLAIIYSGFFSCLLFFLSCIFFLGLFFITFFTNLSRDNSWNWSFFFEVLTFTEMSLLSHLSYSIARSNFSVNCFPQNFGDIVLIFSSCQYYWWGLMWIWFLFLCRLSFCFYSLEACRIPSLFIFFCSEISQEWT